MKNNRRILDIITTPFMLRHRWKLDVRHWSMIGYAEKHVDAVNSPDHFFSYSRIVYIISVYNYAKFSLNWAMLKEQDEYQQSSLKGRQITQFSVFIRILSRGRPADSPERLSIFWRHSLEFSVHNNTVLYTRKSRLKEKRFL